LSYGLGS